MSLLELFKHNRLYIKVSKNYVEIIDVDKNIRVSEKSEKPFSSERLLIAEFNIAENFMNDLILKLKAKSSINRYSSILFHPLDYTEGGIAEVENRIFLEIAERLKGKIVKVWEGKELTNSQVIKELKNN